MKLPSNWCSNVPMNKPLSLVRYNYARACKMHTCSSGKCHTRIYHQDGGHTIGNKHHHHNGCLLLYPHRLRHMRPRSIGLMIPSLLRIQN